MTPTPQRPPDNAFRFLLDDSVNGSVWETEPGIWIGCIEWGPDQTCTDFTLPQPHRSLAIRDVREAYRLNYCKSTD